MSPFASTLVYARVANIGTAVLIDDELDSLIKLPAKPKHR
jgi:hypothetical protein